MKEDMECHFTATVYLLHKTKILLLFHPKLEKWLPPGGHLEPNESPSIAAKREVFEETGLHFTFLNDENIWIDRWNAKSFERPYLCLIEEVPEHKGVPYHQHFDFIYVGQPLPPLTPISQNSIRWFTLEEMEALKDDDEIFVETKQIARTLLSKVPSTAAVTSIT